MILLEDTMNPVKLKERQVAIAATPLGHRNVVYNGGRRKLPKNNISTESPIDQSYSNFFEYEQELAGMKPSSELFSSLEHNNEISNNRTILEETSKENTEEFFEEESTSNNSSIILEDVDHEIVTSFDFIQCEFIKQNGERCKRQAPKNHKVCSKHKNLTLI